MNKLLQNIGIAKELFEQVHCYRNQPFEQSITLYNSVLHQLKEIVDIHPNKPFITDIVNNNVKGTITYREFYTNLLKVAAYLKNKYELSLGDRVVILPANNSGSVLVILAIMMNNATAVVLNPTEPIDRIKEQIAKSESKFVINGTGAHIEVPHLHYYIEDVLADGMEWNNNLITSTVHEKWYPAIIMFTTGTTSASKPIIQMHYNISVNCKALKKHHMLTPSKTLLCTLPIYYANGLEFTIFTSMISGSHVILCSSFDPLSYLKILASNKVNIASLVPSMLNALTDTRLSADISSLDYFVTAAAPLTINVALAIEKRFNKRIIQGYGLTETTNFSTKLPINLSAQCYSKLMLECDIPSVGVEIFGNEVAILRENGERAEDGEEGEICMKGHNIMAGYLGNAEATRECFEGGWFHSGDKGKFVNTEGEQGHKFLIITGRLKNIIKVGGNALSLEELDRIILGISGVSECISCGVKDSILGEAAVCLIVREDAIISENIILNTLSKSISSYKLPKKIVFIDQIPKTLNGKVNRKLLAEKYF